MAKLGLSRNTWGFKIDSVQGKSWAQKVVYPLENYTDAIAVASVTDLAPFPAILKQEHVGG